MRRHGGSHTPVREKVVAAIAKLYAIFALPAYWFTGVRRARWAVVGCVAVMGAYLLLTLGDVRQVLRSPEGGLLYSYGARILIGDLYHRFQPGAWAYGSLLAQLIAVVPVVVASVAIWVWLRRRLPGQSADERVAPGRWPSTSGRSRTSARSSRARAAITAWSSCS